MELHIRYSQLHYGSNLARREVYLIFISLVAKEYSITRYPLWSYMFRVIMAAPLFLGSLRRLPFCAVQITISTRKKGAFSLPNPVKWASIFLIPHWVKSTGRKGHSWELRWTYCVHEVLDMKSVDFLMWWPVSRNLTRIYQKKE